MAQYHQLRLSQYRDRDVPMAYLKPLMRRNFLEYASYVIVDRAIPDLRDGCKPVQRRILHTLHSVDDGKFHKVANVIGETMKLHPHGDASIGDALVVLANKEYFIEKQGNYGSVITGHRAAAPRYIECRLTDLARETMFSKPVTRYQPSYDGRKEEPIFLPAKLPVILMLGAEGIAVGMSTRILPHNLPELWVAQRSFIQGKKFKLFPDFQQGGMIDVSEYEDGLGKVKVRAQIEVRDPKRLVITEVPYGTTTESVIASIEAAAQKGKVKIGSINDFTTDTAEIEITLPRGVDADETLPQLYAYTDCEVSLNSNIVIIRDRKPEELTVTECLQYLTKELKKQLKEELSYELGLLEDKQHWMTLERIFIEKRVYKPLEKIKSEKGLRDTVYKGMKPYARQFMRKMDDDDVTRLLGLPIRRISAFDIAKHKDKFDEISAAIRKLNSKLRNMNKTTVAYLDDLLDRYGDRYPRRTEISTFETIDKKSVARQNLRVAYDPKTGFFGSQVRGSEYQMAVSEYDRILAISQDGSYRIMAAPKKVLVGKLLYCEIFDPEEGKEFVVVYRDKKRFAYGKLIHIHKFIKNKEYHLVKNKEGRVDLLLPPEEAGEVELHFVPAKRQRIKEAAFDLSELEPTNCAARGTRLAPKPVSKVRH